MTGSAPKLFISYRREETASHAGRLYDAMAARFGERNVFMDIELEPGIDFVDRITEVVGSCHVFLVIVGPTWATLSNGGGRPRITDQEDFVRLEVETALRRRDVRVIPLLVAGARMPHSDELPEELHALTRRNALELSDVRWRYDVGRLMGTLEKLVETGAVPGPAGANPIEGSPSRAPAEVKAGQIKGPVPETDVGTEIGGHRLEAIIGRGGMGVVYRARDLHLDRVVALKVIAPEFAKDPEFRQRFKRESQQAASIRHPNVISIYSAGEEANLLFITMDYVEGTDLKTFIGVRGRLDARLAASVVSQVAAGLEAAHARGLVHRDVKPANVLIDGEGQAYLTDFGLTKRAGPGSALTSTGLIVGTTDYLAPEQIQGDKLDARVDVYALGCVLYEALTGFVPYPRENTAATLWAHINDPPPPVLERAPDVPMEFDLVVRRAMAKDPDQRFISAEAMGRGIDAAARGGASRRGEGVVPKTASEPGPLEPKTEEPTERPPVTAADAHVASQGTAGTGEDLGQTRPGLSATTPAMTEADPSADATTGAPSRRRRNPRMLFAYAVLGLALVIAAVLLVTSGGGDENPSPSIGPTPVPAATKLPADLEWRPIRAATFRRQYAASTAVDGEVMVTGGIGVKDASTTTKFYNPETGQWRSGPGLQAALHHASAVTYKREAVVIGGFVPGDEGTPEVSDRVYVLHGDSWDRMPSLTHARAAAAAAVVGDKIVVVGGQADGKLVPQTEVYEDGEGWTDVDEITTPREHLGAASDGHYLYAIGGRKGGPDTNLGTLERYDPESDRWKTLESMPTPIGGVGAAYVGGRLIAVGGETPEGASDAVQAYEIKKKTWSSSELPKLLNARHGVAVTALDYSLYAIGGAAKKGHVGSSKTAAMLDLSGAQTAAPTTSDVEWQRIRDMPFRRQYAAATAEGGRVWLLGGLLDHDTASAKIARYDPAVDSWTMGPQLPRPLHHHVAVTYKDEVVVIGGFVPGDEGTPEVSDRVYVLHGDSWDRMPSLTHARAAAAAAVVGDKIVVVGGQADGKLVPQTEVYEDGEGWTDVDEITTPREHLGAASDGHYLYAIGGRKGGPDTNLGTLERYDPESDRWKTLESMPTPIGGVGAAYVGGRLIAVGGETPEGASDAVQAYEIKKKTWSSSELPKLLNARHGVAVTALDYSLYAIGGAAKKGHVGSSKTAAMLDFD